MEQISYVYSNMQNENNRNAIFYSLWMWVTDMSLYKFTKNIINNRKIDVFNFGNHLRSFTHINDIVDNLIKLINKFKNHKSSLNRVISIET